MRIARRHDMKRFEKPVFPAHAGIQQDVTQATPNYWIPAFAGMTGWALRHTLRRGDSAAVNPGRDKQRGTALMFALMVMAILSIGTSVLWSQIHSQLAQQQQSWRKEQAVQLAEAGLEQAIATLRGGSVGYTGAENVPLGPGAFTITVTPADGPGAYQIESWGVLDFAAYHYDCAGLRAEVKLSPSGTLERYTWQPIKGEP